MGSIPFLDFIMHTKVYHKYGVNMSKFQVPFSFSLYFYFSKRASNWFLDQPLTNVIVEDFDYVVKHQLSYSCQATEDRCHTY